ncbi:MAG: hypothetical protein ACFCVC_12525 [Acidimicrobiia bacterium]
MSAAVATLVVVGACSTTCGPDDVDVSVFAARIDGHVVFFGFLDHVDVGCCLG